MPRFSPLLHGYCSFGLCAFKHQFILKQIYSESIRIDVFVINTKFIVFDNYIN